MSEVVSGYVRKVIEHYRRSWGEVAEIAQWPQGPMLHLKPDFRVAIFVPRPGRNMWSYATCGMSSPADDTGLELHIFSPRNDRSIVELLTIVAHYHQSSATLGLGHTVNFGRPWLDASACTHGLISLPYLDGPKLEWLEEAIRFLWLVPITEEEREYKKAVGLEGLEVRFEAAQFNYLDPNRPSVVAQAELR
jgi:hypothetical protein